MDSPFEENKEAFKRESNDGLEDFLIKFTQNGRFVDVINDYSDDFSKIFNQVLESTSKTAFSSCIDKYLQNRADGKKDLAQTEFKKIFQIIDYCHKQGEKISYFASFKADLSKFLLNQDYELADRLLLNIDKTDKNVKDAIQELLIENAGKKDAPVEIAKVLVKHGADPLCNMEGKSFKGKYAYDEAAKVKNKGMLEFFHARSNVKPITAGVFLCASMVFGAGSGIGIKELHGTDFDMFGHMDSETAKIVASTVIAVVAALLLVGATYVAYKRSSPSLEVKDPMFKGPVVAGEKDI